jgi:hypothetical protein
MGRTVNLVPNPYEPRSASEMKERLADAIIAKVDSDRLSAAEISKRYSSIRAGDVQNLRRGEVYRYGIYRLLSFAEAVGVKASIQLEAA